MGIQIKATFLDEITSDIPHQNWGKEEWDKDFAAMKAIGIDTVIMIRSGLEKFITYPSKILIEEFGCYDPPVDLVDMEAGYYEFGKWSSPIGTTHSAWNPYDAHIPLLFYGWKVEHGSTSREVHITDIAPTVTQMLHIQQPNACVGEAIGEIVK